MTVDGLGELNLSWLHCNECHRSFGHHNRLSSSGGDGLRVLRSDLMFSFTSCGHFFCRNCVQQHSNYHVLTFTMVFSNRGKIYLCPLPVWSQCFRHWQSCAEISGNVSEASDQSAGRFDFCHDGTWNHLSVIGRRLVSSHQRKQSNQEPEDQGGTAKRAPIQG